MLVKTASFGISPVAISLHRSEDFLSGRQGESTPERGVASVKEIYRK
jgi:hypothetical protein